MQMARVPHMIDADGFAFILPSFLLQEIVDDKESKLPESEREKEEQKGKEARPKQHKCCFVLSFFCHVMHR